MFGPRAWNCGGQRIGEQGEKFKVLRGASFRGWTSLMPQSWIWRRITGSGQFKCFPLSYHKYLRFIPTIQVSLKHEGLLVGRQSVKGQDGRGKGSLSTVAPGAALGSQKPCT